MVDNMVDGINYAQSLSAALKARAEWLEQSELPKLKESLIKFEVGFSSLYSLFLKQKLVTEDPYKQEIRTGELEVPETAYFSQSKGLDEISLRLSRYDAQMKYLCNFYQLSVELLSFERIKNIVNLVKFIDWNNLATDSPSQNTSAVAEITNMVKHTADPITMNIVTTSLANLRKQYVQIMGYLKEQVEYNKELFKLELRESVISTMLADEARQATQVRILFHQIHPDRCFYPELAEEVINEDYTDEGPALKEKVLEKLKTSIHKPKIEKEPLVLKTLLLDGIIGLGSTTSVFLDIANKLAVNRALLESRKKSFWEKVKIFLRSLFSKEPEPVIYDLQYLDPVKTVVIREKVNIDKFQNDLNRKIKELASISSNGPLIPKLEALEDEKIITYLDKTVRGLQSLYKTLSAMDEFFKAEVEKINRNKVKGIKPELASIENAIIRVNSKLNEYRTQKEGQEQTKQPENNPEAAGN
jgi:hypothetical protein